MCYILVKDAIWGRLNTILRLLRKFMWQYFHAISHAHTYDYDSRLCPTFSKPLEFYGICRAGVSANIFQTDPSH